MARIAQTLERHGFFAGRKPRSYVADMQPGVISVAFADGTVATTTSYGEDNDVWEMQHLLDGVAAGLCGPSLAHPTSRPDVPPGSFSLISTTPCIRFGDRRPVFAAPDRR